VSHLTTACANLYVARRTMLEASNIALGVGMISFATWLVGFLEM
jgi:hypothetical protein